MTKNMETVLLNGLMVVSILENGIRASSMAKALILKRAKRDRAFGKWEKESNGSKIMEAIT
jgi:hypothetical protein